MRMLTLIRQVLDAEETVSIQDGTVVLDGRKLVLVGDLVDRGPCIPDVLRIAMAAVNARVGFVVQGNHDAEIEGQHCRDYPANSLSHGNPYDGNKAQEKLLARTQARPEHYPESHKQRGRLAHCLGQNGEICTECLVRGRLTVMAHFNRGWRELLPDPRAYVNQQKWSDPQQPNPIAGEPDPRGIPKFAPGD